MENVIPIAQLPAFIDEAIAKVTEGVRLARERGILAELPKEIQIDAVVVTDWQALEVISKETGTSKEIGIGSENGESTENSEASDGSETIESGGSSEASEGTDNDSNTGASQNNSYTYSD